MISGLLFGMFIPGFLITLIFFKEIKILERILLSISYSIMITIGLAISLGYNENVKNFTGGINSFNLWLWELGITAVLAGIAAVVYRKNIFAFINHTLNYVKKKKSIKKGSNLC